jgi:hypothetical protein
MFKSKFIFADPKDLVQDDETTLCENDWNGWCVEGDAGYSDIFFDPFPSY